MAHFAQLNENDIVLKVVVVNNRDITDSNGEENENIGIQYLKNIFGNNTKWIQTSYNHNFRIRFASIGDFYDEVRDAFIPQKSYNSWIFSEEFVCWIPPISYPNDGSCYEWDENILNWISC